MHIWEWAFGWISGTKKIIDKPGLQYRLVENHLHHRLPENHLQYRDIGNRLHYRVTKDQ